MLNNLPDLNRLKVFHFVYKSGSVTRASEMLHLTRSAVSQTIKLLEEEIGEKLFLRKNRALTPTDAARSLDEATEPFLESIDARFSGVTGKDGPAGIVRLSAPPLFGARFILPCMTEFMARYPHVRFQISLTASVDPLMLLEEDKLDMCIVDSLDIMYGGRGHFLIRKLMTDPEYIVCSGRYWKKYFSKEPACQTLLKGNFLSYHKNGAEICAWLKDNYNHDQKVISPMMVVDTPELMLYAIKKDLGMGLLPASMIKEELRSKKLVIIGGKKAVYQNHISIVTMREKGENQTQSLFIDSLMKIV